jgi:glycerol-3-phosphate acyltransferase PlsY
MSNSVTFCLLAYMLGSIPFAVVVSRLFGLADPRSFGSGNPGATNVLRTGNKLAAVLTLLGDAGKGWLAVLLVQPLGPDYGATVEDQALVGFAAFYGHLHSMFLGFRGGKGVATAAGVLFGLNVWLGLSILAVWLLAAFVTRYSSLAGLCAAAISPVAATAFFGWDIRTSAIGLIALMLFMRHWENIKKLSAGTEGRIGERPSDQPPADNT